MALDGVFGSNRGMDAVLKWIGGGTAAVAALLLVGLTAGRALDVQGTSPDTWLTAEDVLDEANDGVLAAPAVLPQAPAASPEASVAPAPAPAVNQPFVIKRILPIDGPIKYGQWFWDDAGVPDGPLVMTVDLDARVLSVFRGGYEIGAAAVLLGTDKYPTPLGTFPILSKERYNVSEKYDNAPMPWTLRLTRDGVAIHGGATVENGFASHGCIGSPDEFVAKLFEVAKKGDIVIITRGKTAKMGDTLI